MAAAHVSGIVALLLSISPNLDPNSIRELLLSSSKVVGGMRQVDAAAAVIALRNTLSTSRR
jgi:subtilisin family serine protease